MAIVVGIIDLIYELASKLPRSEEYDHKLQIMLAATSAALNVSEGSTGQTDVEQARFLGMEFDHPWKLSHISILSKKETYSMMQRCLITSIPMPRNLLQNFTPSAAQFLRTSSG